MLAGQAQKEFFVNEALARLDLLLHAAVEGELASPPDAPDPGACYLVAATAGDDWTGRDGQLAGWDGTAWTFATPPLGTILRDISTGSLLVFDQQWQRFQAPAEPTGGTIVDSEARTAIIELVTALRSFGIFS